MKNYHITFKVLLHILSRQANDNNPYLGDLFAASCLIRETYLSTQPR